MNNHRECWREREQQRNTGNKREIMVEREGEGKTETHRQRHRIEILKCEEEDEAQKGKSDMASEHFYLGGVHSLEMGLIKGMGPSCEGTERRPTSSGKKGTMQEKVTALNRLEAASTEIMARWKRLRPIRGGGGTQSVPPKQRSAKFAGYCITKSL